MGYKFLKYSPGYLASLTKLLDDSFSIENKDKEELLKWKYFDNYHKKKTVTYIAVDNTTVVSHYANLPIPIVRLNKIYKAMICTDMCTAIKHRGKGLISELSKRVYEVITKNKFDFSIGFSNDEGVKVDKYANNYEYHIVGKFVRYFKLVVYRKNIPYTLIKTTEFHKIPTAQSSALFKIKKDYEYLTWRYIHKPNSDYSFYSILDKGTDVGYVILRFIGFKCYVYDIVTTTDEKKHMISVLRSIENKALDHNIRLIIYNVLDNSYWKTLFNKYKYFKRENNPINYYLTIKIHNKNISKDWLLNKENWLIMNGDIL